MAKENKQKNNNRLKENNIKNHNDIININLLDERSYVRKYFNL